MKNGFFTLRPSYHLSTMIWTVDRATEGPNASLGALLDFFPPFLMTQLSGTAHLLCRVFVGLPLHFSSMIPVSSFFYNIEHHAETKFSANNTLLITLLVQKSYLQVSVKWLNKQKTFLWKWSCTRKGLKMSEKAAKTFRKSGKLLTDTTLHMRKSGSLEEKYKETRVDSKIYHSTVYFDAIRHTWG